MTSIPHLPSLKQLRYLVALEEHRHFGKAAAACFVSQSTLSAGLKELETALDAELVELEEHRHFGKAAAACFVSQSTLSAGLKELETALDAELVERNNRTVVFTAL